MANPNTVRTNRVSWAPHCPLANPWMHTVTLLTRARLVVGALVLAGIPVFAHGASGPLDGRI